MWIFIGIIILGVSSLFLQDIYYRTIIQTEVESLESKVLSIKRKGISTGPFELLAGGRTIYKVSYRINNHDKEGWVKFGGFSGTDWRL